MGSFLFQRNYVARRIFQRRCKGLEPGAGELPPACRSHPSPSAMRRSSRSAGAGFTRCCGPAATFGRCSATDSPAPSQVAGIARQREAQSGHSGKRGEVAAKCSLRSPSETPAGGSLSRRFEVGLARGNTAAGAAISCRMPLPNMGDSLKPRRPFAARFCRFPARRWPRLSMPEPSPPLYQAAKLCASCSRAVAVLWCCASSSMPMNWR
jgi:hypothetical protein